MSAPAALFAVAQNLVMAGALIVAFILVGKTLGVMFVSTFTVVIPNELRGLCFAVISVCNAILGVASAPLIVSALSDEIGGPHAIGTALAVVGVATSALGALVFGLGRRAFPGKAAA